MLAYEYPADRNQQRPDQGPEAECIVGVRPVISETDDQTDSDGKGIGGVG